MMKNLIDMTGVRLTEPVEVPMEILADDFFQPVNAIRQCANLIPEANFTLGVELPTPKGISLSRIQIIEEPDATEIQWKTSGGHIVRLRLKQTIESVFAQIEVGVDHSSFFYPRIAGICIEAGCVPAKGFAQQVVVHNPKTDKVVRFEWNQTMIRRYAEAHKHRLMAAN